MCQPNDVASSSRPRQSVVRAEHAVHGETLHVIGGQFRRHDARRSIRRPDTETRRPRRSRVTPRARKARRDFARKRRPAQTPDAQMRHVSSRGGSGLSPAHRGRLDDPRTGRRNADGAVAAERLRCVASGDARRVPPSTREWHGGHCSRCASTSRRSAAGSARRRTA